MDVRTKKAFTTLKQLARANGGYLRTADAAAHGVNRPMLAKFVAENEFERVARGIYMGPEAWPDEDYILQLQYPRLIFSHDSALLLHDMTDCLPGRAHVTLWTGYNPRMLTAADVKVFTVKPELHEMGLITMNTVFGNPVRTYDRERTLCDVVRSRSQMKTQAFYDTLKTYARNPDKDWARLNWYAEALRIRNVLDHYLEVLMV